MSTILLLYTDEKTMRAASQVPRAMKTRNAVVSSDGEKRPMKIDRTSAPVTRPQGSSRPPRLARRFAPPPAALVAVLFSCALAAPASGGERRAVPSADERSLAEMVHDVLRPAPDVPEVSLSEHVTPEGIADAAAAGAGPAEPEAPVAPIAPAREGTFVATPPGLARAAKADVPSDPASAGYASNTWRQRPRASRALGFSSGVRAAASGLDPALQAEAGGPVARARKFVYGFLLLRGALDEAVEEMLARLGVELLGPHDDHYKARLPVDALEAIAALPEVEWVGMSEREQKQSRELSGLRRNRVGAAGAAAESPLPIVVNLFDDDADGAFRRELESAGVTVGEYDPALRFYRGVATQTAIDTIAAFDFVLFVELVQATSGHHDQSMPLIDADMIRPGSTPLGLTRFDADTVTVGIMDTGFMIGDAAPVAHWDLDKNACGLNFTTDAAGTFNDQHGHGTHVLATIAGSGTANPRYRGIATGVGTTEEIRAAKVLKKDNKGLMVWAESAMDFMSGFDLCESAPPEVINMSLGAQGTGYTGTDSTSRKLDDKVFNYGQLYVVSAGNDGPTAQTINAPAVAKNALTVGNVLDRQYLLIGDLTNDSSRGPTGDGRMKPNVVAPGNIVTSAAAGSTTSYTDKHGTSMAAPHVTGLAATLLEHYPDMRGRPALVRSHLMATAIPHEDVKQKSDSYGLGRVSGYLAHWAHPNSAGWTTHWTYGGVKGPGFAYGDVTVPVNAKRLVVVLTWDEPAASAGASRAVTYDLDLWADRETLCNDPSGACGEFASQSNVDNVEFLVIENPPAGLYRLKVVPVNSPTSFPLPYGMTAMIVRGDTTPAMTINMTPPATPPTVGTFFEVKTTVATPAYIASGVQIVPVGTPPGLTFQAAQTMRHDGVPMAFASTADYLTLGNLVPTHSRTVSHWFKAEAPGAKTFQVRAWSENGGEIYASTTFFVQAPLANLVPGGMGTSPSMPTVPPGSSFSVSETTQNSGQVASTSSKTRYYLSLDAAKGAGDRLLTAAHSVPALAPGASHSATVQLSIPASTPLASYFLLACADDLSSVDEGDEGDNCIASPGATVSVTRPDLVTSNVSAPPATAKRGGKIQLGDTAQNVGAVAAPPTRTRYYLSLDAVKGAGDRLLTGGRAVAALAPGASRSATASLTVPSTTPFSTYFVLACADDTSKVVETVESNNCTVAAGSLTVVP